MTIKWRFLNIAWMRSENEHKDGLDPSKYRELRVLTEVEVAPEVTQRELSRRVGIALGLTNILLHNLIQKGYLRATQAGWKRWFYNLTPEGLSQKVRLTVNYIHRVLDHYHSVRDTLRERLQPLALHEESRVAILGTGELAELIYLGLKDLSIEEVDIFASKPTANGKFLGMPVRDVAALQPKQYDRVIVAELYNVESIREKLEERSVGPEQVVTLFGDHRSEDMS